MTKVSVVMNCYNGAAYVRSAIESVYAQSFQDWEIIFWDNASTDQTAAIAKSFDSRIRYFCSAENVPLGHARRLAMAECRGEWIGFLDSDDLWYPDKLEKQLSAIAQCPDDTVLCYAGVREQLMDGTLIREALPRSSSGDIFAQQLVQFDINMVTPLLRRASLETFKLTFDDRIQASEEYNLFMRLLAKGPACVVNECLGIWNIRAGSLTDQSIARWATERRLTLEMVREENPGIDRHNAEAFAAAEQRACYYDARYQMAEGKGKAARASLSASNKNGLIYRLLYLLTFLPFAWRLAHSDIVRRRISKFLFKAR